MAALSVVLIVAGGLAQISGVVLLAVEVRATRQRLERYVKRPQIVEAGTAYAEATVFAPGVVVDPPPPIDERVRRVEQRVTALQEQLDGLPAQLKQQLRTEVGEANWKTDPWPVLGAEAERGASRRRALARRRSARPQRCAGPLRAARATRSSPAAGGASPWGQEQPGAGDGDERGQEAHGPAAREWRRACAVAAAFRRPVTGPAGWGRGGR
jgi:hypothetical protein